MNIAYFIDNVINHGGTQRIIIDKANYLAGLQGYNVYLVCLGSKCYTRPAYPIDIRVQIYHLDESFNPSCSLYKNPIRFAWQWLKWRRSIARKVKEFHAAHHIDLSISLAYDCTMPYNSKRIPHIYESHAYRPMAELLSIVPRLTHFVVSNFVTRGANVVALTQADASEWKEAARVEIIPNFTNIRPAGPYNPNSKKIIAVGRLDDQKGFDLLVKAWSKVAQRFPNHSLEIFGSGQLFAQLDQLIKDKGLIEHVHLRGVTDDMPAAFSEGEAFVLSSRFEGFPLVLIEAMACGIPPVAFDCPHGPSDLVDDGLNGILVPFKNLSDAERIDKLADGLCRMLALSDEEREQMSAEAMKKAASFSREAIMERWVKLFKEVAECE